jgi:HD superfamily phosphohydrolase
VSLNSVKPNKRKIINDPIYGFISIPYELVFDLIEHPWFQRLRRIRQLGLTSFVYPGALHTRFHHAIGAMYLSTLAVEELRNKGFEISKDEAEGVAVAVLLHDIGHGPFSHALENSIVHNISHEDVSLIFMEKLNEQFNGKLKTGIEIFVNTYSKKFLHQLVSSQLDMDRLDYLKRDSFYTGVSEGVISSDRIIKMLTIVNDELAVEEKGIYSVEKFIMARRLMYWQVYLHKTVLSAENLLIKILSRAKELAEQNVKLFATPAFENFLYSKIDKSVLENDSDTLENFAQLDDNDIYASIKVWQNHSDKILSLLCTNLINRHLYKIEIASFEYGKDNVSALLKKAAAKFEVTEKEVSYFVFTGTVENKAYTITTDSINILMKNGEVKDVANASDHLNINALSETVKKFFLCQPKNLG